jgi:hypothetical protein
MEPSGRNRWQPVANAARREMVRRGQRFESVRGLRRSACSACAFVITGGDVSERRRPRNVHRSECRCVGECASRAAARASVGCGDVHLASTRGHSSSGDSFFLRGFRARGFPVVPAVPLSSLDGKEGSTVRVRQRAPAKAPHAGLLPGRSERRNRGAEPVIKGSSSRRVQAPPQRP